MNRQDNSTGYGYIIVRVSTARGAIPLDGATVTVRNYDPEFEVGRGDVISVYTTNSSGLTERFALPAPPRELSMAPGNGKSYESYNLTVTKDGYFDQEYINVPVFEGITAIQNADLVPLPENGQTDREQYDNGRFFENENPKLEATARPMPRERED